MVDVLVVCVRRMSVGCRLMAHVWGIDTARPEVGMIVGDLRLRLPRRRIRDGCGSGVVLVATMHMIDVEIIPRRALGYACHVLSRCSR